MRHHPGDNRKITYGKVGLETSAAAGPRIPAGDEERLSAVLGGTFTYSPEVTRTDNAHKNTRSYTYSSSVEYGTTAGHEAGPPGADTPAATTRTGTVTVTVTVTVTYDKTTGRLVRVDMTRTVEGGGRGDTGVQIVTGSLGFAPGPDGDDERAVAEWWLKGNHEQAASPFQYMFEHDTPTSRPGDDDPFGRLMFDKGRSSRMVTPAG
ncbi:hypothetical protein [Streptomyces sp. NPDC046197]|uniref:hypothetical protein n=1 Tax=Streptomyces sp. NPDC046197 TaxID=3154337 RepID=UPI0033D881B0